MKKYKIITEVGIGEEKDTTEIVYMGGSLVARCKNCHKHLASEECPFPGTKEQTEPIKQELYQRSSSHRC